MDELLGEFLAETGESLDCVDLELVRFEQEPDNAEMLLHVDKVLDLTRFGAVA